jgi:hypothetical protein
MSKVTAQFCNTTVSNQGALTVTTTTQTTSSFGSGVRSYFTFAVENGCTYTFSTCGLTSVNTMLRIYNSTTVASAGLVASNDDACSSTQSSVSFTASANGTYSILITRSSCAAFNAGTNAQLSYVKSCPAPPAASVQDCPGAVQICNDASLSGDFDDIGNIADWFPSLGACMPAETNSNWYFFEAVANGTINMTLNPGAAQDFDFAIWNLANCTNVSTTMPIRCSWYAGDGTTGLGNSATDVSEDFAGPEANGWISPLNVVAGQRYYMVIDQWLQATTNFTIDFSFSAPGLLNCGTPLPLDDYEIKLNCLDNMLTYEWEVKPLENIDYFLIEISSDGLKWEEISRKTFSQNNLKYKTILDLEGQQTEYIRISEIDYNGKKELIQIDKINCEAQEDYISIYPNPNTGTFKLDIFGSKPNDQSVLIVYDQLGQIVYSDSFNLKKGMNTVALSLDEVSAGLYYLEIKNENHNFKSVKFIVE